MASPTAKWPTQADHRFIQKMASLLWGGKALSIPGEFDRVSRVFSKAGGSWERLFRGSPDDIDRLKTVMKVAFKFGYITKTGKWS